MLVRLENTTKKLCVIGDPVLHSLSPLIQNTMLSALALPYLYLCQTVPKGETAEWVKCARFTGYAGFNATMPHKEALLPLLDHADEGVLRVGAANTVCIKDGELYGYNTDGPGFLRALAELDFHPGGKRILLLGAGGAAKAVALSLADAGAREVVVCNRTLAHAQTLCAHSPVLRPAGFSPDELSREAEGCGLLVNCTSLGMAGTARQFETLSFLSALPAGAVVCDLIYAPRETLLLSQARALGHPAMNGLGMLIHQAILALEHFTGLSLDAAEMARLVKKALPNE